MLGVAGVVKGADRGGRARRAVEIVPEIVADEGVLARKEPTAVSPGRIQLRIPGMGAQAEVVAQRRQRGAVELDAGVDAVIARPVWRQRASEVRIDGIEPDPGARRLGRAGGGTGEPSIVEIDAQGAVGRGRQVRLELVSRAGVVVDPDRLAPRNAAVEGA